MIDNDHAKNMNEWTELPGHELPIQEQQIIKHRFQRAIELVSDKDVLEVGSGSGIGLNYLSQHTKSIIGLEYSKDNIILCNENYPDATVIEGDAHSMPFENDSFDIVIAMAMIYYLSFDEFMEEAKRVLRPNGILYFCTSNKDVPGFVPALYTKEYFTVSQLSNKLKTHGFSCHFEGAFPRPIKSQFVSLIRATIKNIVKHLFLTVPGGAKKWAAMREKTLGDIGLLPPTLDVIDTSHITVTSIPDTDDGYYRVIYCIASKH